MGTHTVHFRCHHCGHCCTDVVCLPTPWDVIRIVKQTGQNPYAFLAFLTPEDVTGVNKSDPTWLDCQGKRYIMALRRGKKGCYFLHPKTRFCTAYEARPILCRLYPFKLHETRAGAFKAFSLHTDVGCPRHRDGLYETGPLYALYTADSAHQEDYAQLVEVFNRRRYPDKRPDHFVEMFVTGFSDSMTPAKS
ncbi:MAG TPA: YkgJ family cysteine cluster protein [Candidatus Hydrogenedentes bacterium]|nr:YkgJ family cysteine cluster protein [Candidatus Hydrogenedentota bacterium]HOS02692.1 YkgJ family cysteine cluster protein [Candidatus Hydrogenedentota bacterium]